MDTIAQEKRRLLSLLDAIDQVAYVADPQSYELLYANETVRKLIGHDPIGTKCYESLQGESAPCHFCSNPMIFGENLGKSHLWEVQNRLTGQWFRCLDRAIEWFDGRYVRFEIAFDITDRKEAEDALSERVKELSALQEIATLLNRAKTIEEGLRGTAGVLPSGFRRPEKLHTAIEWSGWLLPSEGYVATSCQLQEPLLMGTEPKGRIIVNCQEGRDAETAFLPEERALLKSCAALLGQFIQRMTAQRQLLELNMELSDRVEKELLKRLKSERLYRDLFKNAPEGIALIDRQGRVRECNENAAAMLGCTPKELEGQALFNLQPDSEPDAEAIDAILSRVFEGRTEQFEWQGRRADAQPLDAQVILAPPPSTSPDEALCIWRDTTAFNRLQREQRLQQAALIQQSKLADLGNMIGAIAHQWRQPLNAIHLMAQDLPDALAAGELDAQTARQLSGRILKQVEFMNETLDEFRNFYRPTRQMERFDAIEAITQVLSLLQAQMRQKNIAITTSGLKRAVIQGHTGEFKQVILNILNNAREALAEEKSPQVTIEAEAQEGELLLHLCDNGDGIDEALIEGDLFEPFVTTKGERGTGVGLWLGRTIIEKMGGHLKAYNRPEGACFEIVLPLIADEV